MTDILVDQGPMATQDLLAALEGHACVTNSDRTLSLSSALIRSRELGLVAVGGEQGSKIQISAFIDALHWHRHELQGQGTLRFVLGRGKDTESALHAVATLLDALKPQVRDSVRIEVNLKPVTPSPPDFEGAGGKCLSLLRQRQSAQLPSLASKLLAAVGCPCFRWYRPLTSSGLSGRVEGLEACKILPPGDRGVLDVGKPGKNGRESTARTRFKELTGLHDAFNFNEGNVEEAAVLIRALADDRTSGPLKDCDPEHRLESRILRGDLEVEIPNLGKLEPVVADVPFQFPTQWVVDGAARYVDALMRVGSTPLVLELKEISGGQGQYYRHAVGQAVLYRSFIRQAKLLHPWFDQHGLKAADCRAAVIFLELRGSERRRSQLLDDLTWMGELFDVAIVPLRLGREENRMAS